MSCNSCCDTSCPAPVPVTVNVTEINFDGENASFRTARFSRAGGTITADTAGIYRVISLPYVVSQPQSVVVALNSGVQRYNEDYVVSGDKVYLALEPQTDDVFVVNWFSSAPVEGTSSLDVVGSIRGFASNPGAAWLAMDGVTAHSKATYPDLAAWLVANAALVAASDLTTFTLANFSLPFYNGSTLESLQGYIHV